MSAKTKIVVLHMKALIYTGIFAALGILFIVLLIVMFLPDKKDDTRVDSLPEESSPASAAVTSDSVYIPGIYTTQLILGGQTVDVEVIVDKDSITSVRLVNPNEAVTTMYPLLQPTIDSLSSQIYETQSLEQISYESDSKYTSLVLLEAIQSALDKAAPSAMAAPDASGTDVN